jgi:hypothetical protein
MDQVAGQHLREESHREFGVDLTGIEGVGVLRALTLLTEVGPDLSVGPEAYAQKSRARKLATLQKTAKLMGFELAQSQPVLAAAS